MAPAWSDLSYFSFDPQCLHKNSTKQTKVNSTKLGLTALSLGEVHYKRITERIDSSKKEIEKVYQNEVQPFSYFVCLVQFHLETSSTHLLCSQVHP